jgi:hypothetical protein
MSRVRSGRFALVLVCASTGAGACAADPGDGPKGGDGGGSSSDDGPTVPQDSGTQEPGAGTLDSAIVAVDSSIATDSGSASETGAADAVPEAAPPDAPPDVATCTTCPLVVQYMTPTTTVTSQEIRPHVEIVNNGASSQDMTVLKLRYYFTAEGSTSQAYDCDYAVLGCGILQATFQAMATPTATADHYMEVSFTGGSIAAGSNTGEIQTRFHDTNFAVTFTQTNDYSFNAADTAYTQWNQITLYRSGTLVWGVEP